MRNTITSMSIPNLRHLEQFKKSFNRGDMLFREGSTGSDLFILLSGEITVIKGDQQVGVITKSGSYVGEIAALLKEPREATCVCTKSSDLVCIPQASLEAFFKLAPDFGYRLARCLADRLIVMNGKYLENQTECERLEARLTKLQGDGDRW